MSRHELELLRQLQELPLPPSASQAPAKARGRKPGAKQVAAARTTRAAATATPSDERAMVENFAAGLAEENRQLQAEVKQLRKKADGFDQVRELVRRQAKVLETSRVENDRLENRILQVLGIRGGSRQASADDDDGDYTPMKK